MLKPTPVAILSKTALVAVIHFFAVFSLLVPAVFGGVLDTAFGAGGKATVEFPFSSQPNYDSYGFYVFVQPLPGRIVGVGAHRQQGGKGMATGVGIAGLNSSGILDPTFADGGRALEWHGSTLVGLSDAQMLPDGSILRLSQYIQLFGPITTVLRRINADGTLDNSFSPDLRADPSQPLPGKFAVQSDGKIFVIVKSSSTPKFYLIKLNADGTRDATFGANGVKEIPRLNRLPEDAALIGMQVLPNGKIIIAGKAGFANSTLDYNELFLLRLDSNGDADHSFGLLGLVRRSFAGQRVQGHGLIVQPDNKYLITGSIKNPDEDALMLRFTQRGKSDSGFGNAGVAVTDFFPGGTDGLRRAKLSADGKIIAAGFAATPTSAGNTDFLVARFSPNGSPEAHTRTVFTPSQYSVATDVAIQPDGKIVVIGYTNNPNASINGNVFAFARYTNITND